MTSETPTVEQVMDVSSTADVENVKVQVAAATPTKSGLPIHAKLAHLLAIVVAGVIALCVSAVLADGTSVIKLKPVKDLPIATNPELKSKGLKYRLDQLLGPTYGVGLHHDQSGFTWTETGAGSSLAAIVEQLGTEAVIAAVPRVISTDALKHPVHFLSCHELEKAGIAAESFGFIAEIVAVLMVIFHGLVLAGLLPSKIAKPVASLVWLVLSVGFVIVVGLAVGIYTTTWKCANTFIPEITLSEHFNYSYGFAFAIIGFIASVLVFNTTLFFTSMKDGSAAPQPAFKPAAAIMALVGVVVGLVFGMIIAMIVGAGNSAFDPPKAVDPDVNPCEGQKPYHAGPGDNYFSNTECVKEHIVQTLEQAGGNVTKGYVGGLDAKDRMPITEAYDQTDLCPVNVHWHLGAEHLSVGQFDDHGYGPGGDDDHRRLAGDVRLGGRCHHYKANDAKFTTPFDWKHCSNMHVGETYEIHWPHSAAGACGTKHQYQTPFYDGVFCHDGIITIAPLNTYEKIGVQAQIFTVVNDEAYYYPDLLKGMIVEGDKGQDIAKYTGSTTGTSRDNEVCSRYTPITWQVDRKCHMISASSFDKLCADMMEQADDMKDDTHPHGAREIVAHHLTANNQQDRK